MSLQETFAKNVKRTREQKKLSQIQVAEKAGCSVSYVSMLERGMRSPPLDTVELFGKALGVHPLVLLQRP